MATEASKQVQIRKCSAAKQQQPMTSVHAAYPLAPKHLPDVATKEVQGKHVAEQMPAIKVAEGGCEKGVQPQVGDGLH